MKKVKIIRRFFKSKSEVKNSVSYHKKQVAVDGFTVDRTEIVSAYELFSSNGWLKSNPFKSLGKPQEGDYMIVLYLKPNKVVELKPTVIKLKPRVKKAVNAYPVVNYKRIKVGGRILVERIVSIIFPQPKRQVIDISFCPELLAA